MQLAARRKRKEKALADTRHRVPHRVRPGDSRHRHQPNPLLKDSFSRLATTQKGTIIVDEESMRTNVEKVYAGGDAVTGAATVILAMGAGKKAARHMLMEMGSLPRNKAFFRFSLL